MAAKSLVVLAAGIGSRYGGLKQLDPVGPGGEVIVDYSVFDARRAGFEHVVFVIRPDIEDEFRQTIGARISPHIDVRYVHQALDQLPGGLHPPEGRTKPWGTGQATLVAGEAVEGPFAVINADDFYGAESYRVLADFLEDTSSDAAAYGMIGFILKNTLSDHGSVSRGVCSLSDDGRLSDVVELTRIEKTGAGIAAGERALSGEEIVSMNMWGFKPSFFSHLEEAFRVFLDAHGTELTSEFFLPAVVNDLGQAGVVTIDVMTSSASWYGVTYREERDAVRDGIRALIQSGAYPESLW